MNVRLRPYDARHFEFARKLYFETMRWAITADGRRWSTGGWEALDRAWNWTALGPSRM